MRVWKAFRSLFRPPKGKSERTRFSLGRRPMKGEVPEQDPDPGKLGRLTRDLDGNVKRLKAIFHESRSSDVVFKEITSPVHKARITLAYIEGISDSDAIHTTVLQPLMLLSSLRKASKNLLDDVQRALVPNGQVSSVTTFDGLVDAMVQGDLVVLLENESTAFSVDTKGWEHRNVDTAVSERIVRGPQQGFVEVLRTNTAIVRSLVRSPDLVVESIGIGLSSKNECALLYMANIANDKIVAELRRRISSISTSDILTSGVLEQFIETHHSLLPTTMSTERPDRVAFFLMQGGCAVIVSGDPFALVAPVTAFSFLQSPEDQYIRWPYGNILRAIRYMALFIVIFLPGIYVAVINYHPEMVPTSLLMAIAASREPIPLPLSFEVVLMYLGFELIREAGIRIPSPIGPTIGIVGALLIGEAAVSASVVSPILVIIIAVTAVASFTVPNQELAMFTRIATLLFIMAGALFGLFGIVALTYAMLCHAFSLTSLGVPYFSPSAPRRPATTFTVGEPPVWSMKYRPKFLKPKDVKRSGDTSRLWDEGQTLFPAKRRGNGGSDSDEEGKGNE